MDAVMPILLYFLRANAVLVVLGVFYLALLRKNAFYTLNRFYFLLLVAATCTLPLIDAPFSLFSILFSNSAETALEQTAATHLTPVTGAGNGIAEKSVWLYWQLWILLVLALGALVRLFKLTAQLISLYLFTKDAKVQHNNGARYYTSSRKLSPFSFFGFIYVNTDLYDRQELSEILAHERVHVRQLHSVDILLLEVFRCIFWVNPFARIIQKEAKLNLEYMTDRQVLSMGFSVAHYQYTLLKVASDKILPIIASEFKMSNLKKRIVMMKKANVSKVHLFKYCLMAPLFVFLWLLAAPSQAKDKDKYEKVLAENGNIHIDGSNPLILVNGVEVSGELKFNPDRIESISVIKDVHAVKPYGSKGKNGVVLIAMKESENEDYKAGDSFFSEEENDNLEDDLQYVAGSKVSESLAGVTMEYKEGAPNLDASGNGDSTCMVYITNLQFGSLDNATANEEERTPSNRLEGEPLIIVDGLEFDRANLNSLASEEIESISVIKNKKAKDLYGGKAENGVVVIRTKKI